MRWQDKKGRNDWHSGPLETYVKAYGAEIR